MSVTWAMSQAPRGEVRENVLARLIAPHGDIARKRVTLLYRVIDPGEAARIVERDLHNAEFRVNSSARPTARAVVEQQRRARDRAGGSPRRGAGELRDAGHGHGLGDEPAAIGRAAVENLAPTARVNLRPVWGSQDSAFAAALPVGLFLPAHLKIPEADPASAMRLPRRREPRARRGRCCPVRAGGPDRGRAQRVPAAAGGVARHERAGVRAVAVLGRRRRAFDRRAAGQASADRRDGVRGSDQLVSARRSADRPDRVRDGPARVREVAACIRRMALSLAGFGVLPLVLGDLKPDYVDLIAALDGQVIRLGRGRGYLNVLDITLAQARRRAAGGRRARKAGRELLADAVGRRHTMVCALISIQRGHPPNDREDSILAAALKVLDERHARHAGAV